MSISPLVILLALPAGYAAGGWFGLAAFDVLSRRSLGARRALAAISAGVALLAPAAPTGLAVWDALLRAGLAGGVAFLAGRSRQAWWVAAAAVAVTGAIGGVALMMAALATLGAAVALAAATRRAPLAGALLGAVLVQLALHLRWPERHGATAILAALVLLPLALSGLRRSPHHQRRTVRRAGLAVGVLTWLGVVTGVVAGLLGSYRAERGADALTSGLDAARLGDQPATARALGQAGGSFADARDVMDAAWLLPARLVPVVSQHVAALQQASRAGNELALTGAETLATADLRALRVENGRLDLDRVRSLQVPLAGAATSLQSAHDELVDEAASPWLVGPVAHRLDKELVRVERTGAQALTASQVADQLPALLGANGPRRYFLAIQSPSELRGSGGIIGSFGEITAQNGAVGIGRFGRDGDLNTQGTPPDRRSLPGPADYRERYARFRPERIWQNVSASPDFPSVGQVVTGLYPQSGGSAVDGVVSVDPVAVAALLGVVGPVTVAPWPEPITAANAERVLLFDQYARLQGSARTDFLANVAQAVANKLISGPLPAPTQLVSALAPAVTGHHLLLHSRAPSEQALFSRIGADGALPPVRADSLAVVNMNAGGNKLDWFLRRSSNYQARFDPGTGRLTARLTVTLRNEAPSSGLPDFIIGSSLDPPDPRGVNRTYLSVYSPLGLAGARLDGQNVPVRSEREAGRNVYSQYLLIPPGGTRTLELDLSGRIADGREYQLDLRSQSLVVPELMQADVTVGGRRIVSRASAPLAGDEVLRP